MGRPAERAGAAFQVRSACRHGRVGNRRGLTVLAVAACVTAVVVSSPAAALRPALGPAPRTAINVNDRAAVIAAYEAEFGRIEPAMEWTGNVAACNGGTTSTAYQQSILQRVNWLRRMAGVADTTYDPALNAQQQAGALISAAERKLNHYPANTAKCWTQAGYDATSRSNLYLGVNGASAMDGYVHDPGSNNTFVGHRWWVLHPGLRAVTSGDIPSSATNSKSNALLVSNTDHYTTPAPRDRFVSWPPPGYVPYPVVYPRWSVMDYTPGSGARSDFTNATVTVTGPSGPLAVTYDDRSNDRIVFVPAGFESAPVTVKSDTTYTVSVSGIANASPSSYSFTFTVVPVNTAPYDYGAFGYGADKCAVKGDYIGGPTVLDREGDAVTVTLVSGEGDTDNALFEIKKAAGSGTVTVAKDLDGTRRDYTVRYRMTDTKGAYTENAYAFTLADTKDGTCPKKTTTTTDPDGPWTSRRTVLGTITRGKSRAVSSYTARPAGTVSYKVTGGCRLSSTKRTVYARKTKGTCTVTMTGRTSSRISVVTLKLRVR